MGQVELYAKKDSLQQTLLETRARLQRWQAVQRDARQAIRVGEWQQATLAAAQTFDGSAATRPTLRQIRRANVREKTPVPFSAHVGYGRGAF